MISAARRRTAIRLSKPGILMALAGAIQSQVAFAAGNMPHPIDYYSLILHAFHLDHRWVPTVGALFVTLLILILGLAYKSKVEKAGSEVVPDGRFNFRFLVDTIMDSMVSLAKDNCHDKWRQYIPVIASLFLFILISNLTGLVPGFPPATVSMDMNLAMGLVVFFVYNYAGIQEHGASYIKHFMGPVIFIAPLFFCIELISHASRPLSLSLRLVGNIFADHTLVAILTNITYFALPALLLFFGTLVAVVQSFVFTLLSSIYISMAISHDH